MKKYIKHLFVQIFVCFLLPGFLFAQQTPQDISVNLGTAGKYTIFVFENLYQYHTDSRGAIAAGDDIYLRNYHIAKDVPEGKIEDTVVAGGDVVFHQGEVHNGNVVYGDDIYLKRVSIHNGSKRKDTPIDFDKEEIFLKKLSADLAAVTPNGDTQKKWGSLYFVGTDNKINVFNVSACELHRSYYIDLEIPEGAKAIINVKGKKIAWFQYKGIGPGFNKHKQNVLFNFSDQKYLKINGVGIKGTILAPNARVGFKHGHVDGSIIAKSLYGCGETHYFPFNSDEDTPPLEPITPVVGTKRTIITLNGSGFGEETGTVYFRSSYDKEVKEITEWSDTKIVVDLATRMATGTYEIIVKKADGEIADFNGTFTIMPIEFDITNQLVVERGKEFTVTGKFFGPSGSGFEFVISDLDGKTITSIKEAYGILQYDNTSGDSVFTATFPESVPAGEYLCRGFNYVNQEWNYYTLIVK